jgi:hypothetical protein
MQRYKSSGQIVSSGQLHKIPPQAQARYLDSPVQLIYQFALCLLELCERLQQTEVVKLTWKST